MELGSVNTGSQLHKSATPSMGRVTGIDGILFGDSEEHIYSFNFEISAKRKLDKYNKELRNLGYRLSLRDPSRYRFDLALRVMDLGNRLVRCKRHIDEEIKGLGRHKHFRQLRNLRGDAVYVVECMGFTKIGYTSTPVWRRMIGLKNANPLPLTVTAICPGTRKVEKIFHDLARAFHHRGEWFKLDDETKMAVLALVKRYKGQVLDPPITY